MVFKRAKIRLLISVLILSTLVSIVSPALKTLAVPTGREGSATTHDSPTQLADKWMYYNALSLCIQNANINANWNGLTKEEVSSGKWFSWVNTAVNNPVKVALGYYLGSTKYDLYGCDGNEWLTNAVNTLGYTDLVQAYCDFGGARTNRSNCVVGDGKFGFPPQADGFNISLFRTAVFNKVGDPNSNLTSAARYIEERRAFFSGCLGDPEKTALSDTERSGIANGDERLYNIKFVDAEGNLSDSYYYGTKKKSDKIYYQIDGRNAQNVKNTCGNIATSINNNANAYKSAIETAPDVGGSNPTSNTSGGTTASTKSMSSCVIEGIGWMICPVMKFIGGVADNSYSVISSLLSLNPALVKADDTSGTYVAWQFFRSIANVLFVIAFLVIIMSQLTSVGISNYGVKKLLPRLIVTAILVNISFYICQIMVDLSEILGHTLNQFLGEAIPSQIKIAAVKPTWVEVIGGILAGTVTIVGLAALAAAGIAAVGLSVSIPVVLMVLLSVFLTFIILIGRQAVIVVLVVISPLALVAYLLPNTEQWFRKWGKMLVSLLMVYPVVSLLYGAGKLTGMIIYKANPDNFFMQISALGVTAIPLIATPSLLKGALNSTGALGAKLSGWSSKANGAIGARVKDSSTLGTTLSDIGNYRNQKRQIMLAKRRTGSGRVNSLLNRMGGDGYGDHVASRGAALEAAEQDGLVKNAGARLDAMEIDGAKLSQRQMMDIALGKDVLDSSGKVAHSAASFDTHARQAAMQKAAAIATVDDAHELVDRSSTMSSEERKTLSSALAGSSAIAKAPYLGGKTLGDIVAGKPAPAGSTISDEAALGAIKDGKITAESLASGDAKSVQKLLDVALKTAPGSQERKNLMAAYASYSDPSSKLREKVVAGGDHDKMIQALRSL